MKANNITNIKLYVLITTVQSSGKDMDDEFMNSQKSWLHVQDMDLSILYDYQETPTPLEEQCPVGACWGRESHILPWYRY